MKTKFLTLLLIACFGIFAANAQKVDFDKGSVTIDGIKTFTYKIESWGTYQFHLYTLDTNKEILFIKKNDNETPKYYDDDFVQIKFIQLGKGLETKIEKPFKKYIEWLIQNEVMSTTGVISEEKLDLFIKNYDEKITARTIR